MFNSVKLLNFTFGIVVLFLSGVYENLGTFAWSIHVYDRQSPSFSWEVDRLRILWHLLRSYVSGLRT